MIDTNHSWRIVRIVVVVVAVAVLWRIGRFIIGTGGVDLKYRSIYPFSSIFLNVCKYVGLVFVTLNFVVAKKDGIDSDTDRGKACEYFSVCVCASCTCCV